MMKLQSKGLPRLIALILAISLLPGCKQGEPAQKLVVLTFDDAVRSHLEYVAPLLKEKGFGATFFVSNAWMNDTANFMQWDEVGELYRMGFEIGNHSWTHVPLHTDEAIAGMEENLARVDSALLAHGVPRPVSFGYPGNHFAPGAIEKVRTLGYQFARRGMQPEIPYGKIAHGPLYDPEVNHALLIPTTADAYPEWTVEYFKSIIERTENGKAIVLQFHGVPDVAHPWVHTDPVLFAQFMDYLEETGANVIAMKDLGQYMNIHEVDDPALQYTHGVPQQYNPCPQEADVWILAGQSNMQGAGRTPDTITHPHIWMMNMDDLWSVAKTPLHRIFEAKAPAYAISSFELSGDPEKSLEKTLDYFKEKAEISRYKPIGGTGPGIYFARHLHENTGQDIGLIPCALGGSTIDQWDPNHSRSGDSCLYGAMLKRIQSTGGHQIKGLIWYQGESEAMLGIPESYETKLLALIDAIRSDLEKPELPIMIVQIGRLITQNPLMAKDWEAIREIQRQIVKKRPNLYLTSGIDLELDDVAHLSTQSNQVLGMRLGEIALTHIYEKPGHANQPSPQSIELKQDSRSGSPYLHLHYKDVNGKLKAVGKPGAFELRIGDQTPFAHVISHVALDPNDPAGLRLFLSAIPKVPAQLICGPGINPYMNITDSKDMPIPAFGPIEIDFKSLENNILILE
jgi:peptidoglycan-N-acetylglucosamine deacetylase